jgi:hypothetical protein
LGFGESASPGEAVGVEAVAPGADGLRVRDEKVIDTPSKKIGSSSSIGVIPASASTFSIHSQSALDRVIRAPNLEAGDFHSPEVSRDQPDRAQARIALVIVTVVPFARGADTSGPIRRGAFPHLTSAAVERELAHLTPLNS